MRVPAPIVAAAAIAAFSLAACQGPPLLTNDGTRPATPSANVNSRSRAIAPSSPALDAIAAAQDGAVQSADDPSLGGPVELTVLRTYNAASGRICKQVSVRSNVNGQISGRVACSGDAGWYWSKAATG